MPAATTHYLFSKDAYELLSADLREKITNINMFYLGSQGPDFLFFYKAGASSSELPKLGSIIHDIDTYEIIQAFYKASIGDDDLTSYFYGFLTHYALDSNAHPLVNYVSRYFNNTEDSEGILHCRIEAFLDTYILNKKGLTKKDYEVNQAIKISKVASTKLAKIYKAIIKDHLKKDVDLKDIEKSIKDASFYLGLLKPNLKLKFHLFKGIEKMVFNGRAKVTSLMLYNDHILCGDKILNSKHDEYFNLCDKDIKYHYSFEDCYNNALKDYQELVKNPTDTNLFKLNFEGDFYE